MKGFVSLLLGLSLLALNLDAQHFIDNSSVITELAEESQVSGSLLLRVGLNNDSWLKEDIGYYNDPEVFLHGIGLDLTYVSTNRIFGFAKLAYGLNLNFIATDGLRKALNSDFSYGFDERISMAPRMTLHFNLHKKFELYTGGEYSFILNRTNHLLGCPCCGPRLTGEETRRGNMHGEWTNKPIWVAGANYYITPKFGAFAEFASSFRAGISLQLLKT